LLPIIDVIIKEPFYHDDNQIINNVDEVDDEDEEDHHMNMERIHKKAKKKITLKCNMMKLFKLNEENKMYTVEVLNIINQLRWVRHVVLIDRCRDLSHQGPPSSIEVGRHQRS